MRHRRCSGDGTWQRILDLLRTGCDEAEGDGWTVSVDSTINRAHQDAAGARRELPRDNGCRVKDESGGREAIGKSRGGRTAKIHLAADRRCRPLATVTTPGQHHDSRAFTKVMDRIRILRRGLGRPRVTSARVLADKAYSSRAIRDHLCSRGIKLVIPEKEDQKAHRRNRGSAGGRPRAFDAERYKDRNTAERCFNKLKGFRAVATRYDCEDEGVPPRSGYGFATPSPEMNRGRP